MNGDSISLEQNYSSGSSSGNINTINQGAPNAGGYMVSTYSPPENVTAPLGNLALYTCSGGSYAQCDGGICFTSTNGKTSPLWGNVSGYQIICSCPVTATDGTFQVFGPRNCPKKAKDYDAICGANVNNTNNNGATIYIGSPLGVSKQLAACLTGKDQ